MTDIGDLIRDAYEVRPYPARLRASLGLGRAGPAQAVPVPRRDVSPQKFGPQSVEQVERMRCRHRIRVLQGHEGTAKQNVVSEAAWGAGGCPRLPVGLQQEPQLSALAVSAGWSHRPMNRKCPVRYHQGTYQVNGSVPIGVLIGGS